MFNEKKAEYSTKQGKDIPVWQTPKYIESKNKAIEIIDSKKYGVLESDFWILMNETKSGKMAYTGLIISHNGCLKINDALPTELKFRPECVTEDKMGYNNSLVFSYCCAEQGIYEVGEVNPKNCKIEYPYAMAFKRMMDRVVLKASKLAFSGIYSEVEADEFRNIGDEPTESEKPKVTNDKPEEEEVQYYCSDCGEPLVWTRTKDGKDMSPTDIRNLSYSRYGRSLCPNCMRKADAEKKASA